MLPARPVTPLAVNPSRERIQVHWLGKRLFLPFGNLWIAVMAKHAIVGDFAAKPLMVRPIIARVHRPMAALVRIPAQRQFNEGVARRPVQESPRVIAGS